MSGREFASGLALSHNLSDRFEAMPAVSRHRACFDHDGFRNIVEQDHLVRVLEAIQRGGRGTAPKPSPMCALPTPSPPPVRGSGCPPVPPTRGAA